MGIRIGFAHRLVVSAVAMSVAAPVAWGQETEVLLPEITVTARKKEESLQDVPLSVTAFDANAIKEVGLNSASDLAAFTPGFSFRSSLGRRFDRPVVRGQSNILGTPNASFFIDGVFVSGSIASTEYTSLERIEVIKGPQAALYGRSTFAGAVNYVTKRPTDEFEGQVTVTAAQHDTAEISGSFSGPLVEDLAYFYVGATHTEYGGEYDNTETGETVGGEETDAITAKLLLTPTENFEATLRLTWQQDDDEHFPGYLVGADQNNCFPFDPTNRPRGRGYLCGELPSADEVTLFTQGFPDGGGIERDALRASLSMSLDIGEMTLTSITGWEDEELDVEADGSYAAYDAFAFLFSPGAFYQITAEENQNISTELRLEGPQDGSFRWLVGAYYFDEDLDEVINDKFNPTNNMIENNGELGFSDVQNIAAFGAVEFDFTDRLTGTAEIRWGEDRISSDFYDDMGVFISGQDETFDSVTPRVTLSYALNEDVTVYGNLARGNKPGGFNGVDAPAGNQSYDEEESTNYEFGIKSVLGGGRTRLNAAVYFIDWEEQQLTFTAPTPTGTVSFIDNVGQTEVLGAELEISTLINENWNLDFSASYTDAEITNYINGDQAELLGCDSRTEFDCVQERGSVSGNQTPRSPRLQLALRTGWTQQLSNGMEWFVNGSFHPRGFSVRSGS